MLSTFHPAASERSRFAGRPPSPPEEAAPDEGLLRNPRGTMTFMSRGVAATWNTKWLVAERTDGPIPHVSFGRLSSSSCLAAASVVVPHLMNFHSLN